MSNSGERWRYLADLLRPPLSLVADVLRGIASTLRLLVIALAVLLLFPVLIVFNFVYVHGRALWLQRYGVRARFDDNGVTLYTHHRGELRRIAYAEIDHFDTTLDPPMWIWMMVLRGGEELPLPLADSETVCTNCARYGVTQKGLLSRRRERRIDD